jgi:hypothetical protein
MRAKGILFNQPPRTGRPPGRRFDIVQRMGSIDYLQCQSVYILMTMQSGSTRSSVAGKSVDGRTLGPLAVPALYYILIA